MMEINLTISQSLGFEWFQAKNILPLVQTCRYLQTCLISTIVEIVELNEKLPANTINS